MRYESERLKPEIIGTDVLLFVGWETRESKGWSEHDKVGILRSANNSKPDVADTPQMSLRDLETCLSESEGSRRVRNQGEAKVFPYLGSKCRAFPS